MNNLGLAFLTGLTTGGISCAAVQGGLLATALTQEEKELARNQKWAGVAMFLLTKLLAYTLLGFGLGALGATFTLSPKLLGWMQILAGLFMLVTAARLLDIHPVFRYFVIQPPKWVYRLAKNQAQASSFFAPAILGFLTILLPCGVTQAMMALAIATANPWLGAGIMSAFVLGTSPIFFALGVATVTFIKKKAFVYLASSAILVLGIVSINNGQVLRGSNHTLQNYSTAAKSLLGASAGNQGLVAGTNTQGQQEVTIEVLRGGYQASASTLKAGVPVKLNLVTNNVRGCIRAFTIPALNLSKILPETGTETLEFTPTQAGRLAYSCSMGMYTGSFEVIP